MIMLLSMQPWQLTIKLILYDIVEDFQQVEDEVMVGGFGKEEPRCGKGLHEVEEPCTGHH